MKEDKFEHLRDILPKIPELWTVTDIGKWLDMLHMTRYKEIFQEMAIDGLLIFDQVEEDLKTDMGIELTLHRKKILKAIDLLIEYGDQLKKENEIVGLNKKSNIGSHKVNIASKGTSSGSTNSNTPNQQISEKNNNSNSKERNLPKIQKVSDQIIHDDQELDKKEESMYYLVEREPENVFLSNMLNGSLDLCKELSKQEKDDQVVSKIRDLTDIVHQKRNTENVLNCNNVQHGNNLLSAGNDNLLLASDLQTNFCSDDDDSLDMKFYGIDNKENKNNFNRKNEPHDNIQNNVNLKDDKNHKYNQDYKHQIDNKMYDKVNQNVGKYNKPKPRCKELVLIKKDSEPYDSKHLVKENGVTMGRNSANGVVVMDETVSRFHSELEFNKKDGQFYFKDIGSTAGTYVIINEPMELKVDMIFEVGSYELRVKRINLKSQNIKDQNHYSSTNFLEISIEEGPDKEETTHIIAEEGVVGRANGSTMTFPDDQHMSFRHCKLYYKDNKYWIQDLNSTNGTLLRLSPEGQVSDPYLVREGMKCRVGITQYFEVEKLIKAE